MASRCHQIDALRARVLLAKTPQEIVALAQELDHLKRFGESVMPPVPAFADAANLSTFQCPATANSWGSACSPMPQLLGACAPRPITLNLHALCPPKVQSAPDLQATIKNSLSSKVRGSCDSTSSTGGTRTPPSSQSSECELEMSTSVKQTGTGKDQSPLTFTIHNTFIDVIDEAGPMFEKSVLRQRRSCPPTPSASHLSNDSCLRILEAAVKRLKEHQWTPDGDQQLPFQEEPDAEEEGFAEKEHEHAFAGNVEAVCPVTDGEGPPSQPPLMVLELAKTIEAQSACQNDLPSAGSALHYIGRCKPCAFVHTKGCNSGKTCQFCHLCDQGSNKRRKKAWREFLRAYAKDTSPGVKNCWAREPLQPVGLATSAATWTTPRAIPGMALPPPR
mmetsp:Transcript_5950/g.14121  ORF Transcript_5950/g.14121 Transcript_5950/m.14121 type:complete len:390 (+) Transcript_5950:71-1240(+)